MTYEPVYPLPRGHTQPKRDATPQQSAEERRRVERQAIHLMDNFLRDRAEMLEKKRPA